MNRLPFRQLSSIVLIATLGQIAFQQPASSQTAKHKASAKKSSDIPADRPREFRSQRFLLHADLSDQEADELLTRLEKMYDLIGAYWGRQIPAGQTVEMYVVKDLKRWPQDSIPVEGLAHIRAGGGVTHTEALSARGSQGEHIHIAARTKCFATYERGTPLHEAVHAFCGLTFGRTGPVWYSEGMAEVGNYWREKDPSVELDPVVLKYLQKNTVKSLNAIINNKEQTGDSWQNYSWRWALCHLLVNNPNYNSRFRPLGLDLLNQRANSFEQTYGEMAEEISFEYKYFLSTIENGYRVDLTAIDWQKRCLPLQVGRPGPTSTIVANRGWQPTQAIVESNKTYAYTATGKWLTAKKSASVTPDGDAKGEGKLLGAVLTKADDGSYALSKPFPLGTEGKFKAPASGKLLARCNDAWGKLADNQGRITFKVKASD